MRWSLRKRRCWPTTPSVKTYTDCLQQEQAAKLEAGGDKVKLQKQYAELNNAQVEKVQQLADKFNTELKAFKAKSAPAP